MNLEGRVKALENNHQDTIFWLCLIFILIGALGHRYSPQIQAALPNGDQVTATETNGQTAGNSENIDIQKTDTELDFQYPLDEIVEVSSGFGWRRHPILGTEKMHNGIDLPGPIGTNIHAIESGVVTLAENFGGCGISVSIQHSQGFSSLYCHNSQVLVKKGQTVQKGQLIAKMGSTGMSTGSHLHLGLKRNGKYVDPAKYIKLK